MDLTRLFAPGGLLVPVCQDTAGARIPRAQFLLNGKEDFWTGLAMVELAARLGYECESGDPERLVVMPGDRPERGAVPVVFEVRAGGEEGQTPASGRVAVVPDLAGAAYGLVLSAPDSRWLWKLAAWLAAAGPSRLETRSAKDAAGGAGEAGSDRIVHSVADSAGWEAEVRYDVSLRSLEVVLDRVVAEPWQPGTGQNIDPGTGGGTRDELAALDHLWSPHGLLGSRDGLHPDHVAVVVEPASDAGTWLPEELAGLIMFAFRLGLESTGLELPLTAADARDRPCRVRLVPASPGVAGQGTIHFCRRSGPATGAVLVVAGDAVGRGRALRWLATAHASERVRPVGSRQPALDSAVVALQREATSRLREAVTGERSQFEIEYSFPSEEERFLRIWQERALAAVRGRCHPDDELWVDIRLDQPEDVLAALKSDVHRSLAVLGFRSERIHVRVLPSFRQGVHWLLRVVPPAVERHAGTHTVTVEFARLEQGGGGGSEEHRGIRCLDLPIRWLQALYPVDELLSARTGLPADRIVFRAMEASDPAGPTYRVILRDAGGRELWHDEFHVATRTRLYQDAHPHLGWVHVETGLCRIERRGDPVNGRAREEVYREFIPSGAELFWDRYQAHVLPQLARVLEQKLAGDLVADRQPFFLTLDVQVQLDTRPDQLLGVREEFYSTAEGLHEDVYFNTLDFFEEWGRNRTGTPFTAPGKVVPRIRACPGKGTRAIIRLTGLGIGGRLAEHKLVAQTCRVTVGADGSARATLRLDGGRTVDMDYDEATRRAARAIGFDPVPAAAMAPEAGEWRRAVLEGEALGRWLATLSAKRTVRWSVAGHSFEGRPVYQVVPVAAGERGRLSGPDVLVVPAKATLFRPTVLFKARHHANEVSSTNALMQLLEEHIDATTGVNCVVMPLENVDGAALHHQLSQQQPRWSLHCARYNALGQEYALEYFGHRRRLAPETEVFPNLWSRWLPDVIVDEHGVPSHEWVQPFGAHGGGRKFTSYWLPRALIYGILPIFTDEALADHARKQRELAAFIAEALERWPEIAEANRRWLAIYKKYAADWLPEVFPVETIGDFVCYRWPVHPDSHGRYPMQRYPSITGVEFITEAADETAGGTYLDTCALAHLAVDLAVLAWIRRQPVVVEETVEGRGGTVYRRRWRRRAWWAGSDRRSDATPES